MWKRDRGCSCSSMDAPGCSSSTSIDDSYYSGYYPTPLPIYALPNPYMLWQMYFDSLTNPSCYYHGADQLPTDYRYYQDANLDQMGPYEYYGSHMPYAPYYPYDRTEYPHEGQSQDNVYEESVPSSPNQDHGDQVESDSIGDEDCVIGPLVTTYGTISLLLRHGIRVDLTVDKAIRLNNFESNATAAMSSNSKNICLLHPSGKALQENGVLHAECKNTMAKITKRGLIFTAKENSLIYLLDASGTKSTTERFRDLEQDVSVELFYDGSVHGCEVVERCNQMLRQYFHRVQPNGGAQVWTIAGVRIKQSVNGDVRISRDFNASVLRTSPTEKSISVSTKDSHFSAGFEPDRLFFVRSEEKRITSSSSGMMYRNGTQTAGFDGQGKIILS